MSEAEQFSYTAVKNLRGETAFRPLIPVELSLRGNTVDSNALLDTGADVNVMPYHLGLSLGIEWQQARTGLQLSGNLAQYEARGVLVACTIREFPPLKLAFAWTRAENIPVIFGQVNFFSEFDVCFFKARGVFNVSLKSF